MTFDSRIVESESRVRARFATSMSDALDR